jgi:protoheme IX farnesyltransferase
MRHLRAYLSLVKWRISLFAALAAGLGYVLKTGAASLHILYPMGGVLMLAAGAGALNQYQERGLDAQMKRTRHRPLPSGLLTPCNALFVASMFILYGLALLGLGSGLQAAALGLFAVIWYNGVYTWLKRITAFASVPGALVGAVPPMIGWISAGGQATDITILALAFFFFIWQIPHFWLLLLKFRDDYRQAGLPTLQGKLSNAQIARITFVWTSAAGTASLLIPLFDRHINPVSRMALVLAVLWLVAGSSRIVRRGSDVFPPGRITLFMLFSMCFLSLGALLG